MDGFKEFQGKDLDAAIQDACSYYNARREKLEIEILQDAKTGIFGIVGARKAKIRARRAHLRDTVQSVLGAQTGQPRAAGRTGAGEAEDAGQGRGQRGRGGSRRSQPQGRGARPAEAGDGAAEAPHEEPPARRQPRSERDGESADRNPARERRRQPRAESPEREDDGERPQGRGRRQARPERPQGHGERHPSAPAERPGGEEGQPGGRRRQPHPEREGEADRPQGRARRQAAPVSPMQEGEEGPACQPLDEADAPRAMEAAVEAVSLLLRPLADHEPEMSASVQDGAVNIAIQNLGDAAPAVIGRDGSTLAAVQYLAGRLASRALDRSVRVSLDAGSYRQRQEEDLRDMAMALAEKVLKSGRSLSTRPLSSFQRRIVHVYLKDVEGIQTRSTGEGALKRVIVMRRRAKGRPQPEGQAEPGRAAETAPGEPPAAEAAPGGEARQ